MVTLVRARAKLSPALLVDGIAAALAVASLSAAIVLQAVLEEVEGDAVTVATALAYPITDCVLLAVGVGALAGTGWRLDRTWALLAAGILAFWFADSMYLVRTAQGVYEAGGWFDAGWWAGLTLIAAAAWQTPPARRVRCTGDSLRLLIAPLVSGAVGLELLVYASMGDLNPLAVGLAAAALVFVMIRLTLTFRQNVGILRASRDEALTDALTGLGNRRALSRELDDALAVAAQPESPADPRAVRPRRLQALQRHLRPPRRRRPARPPGREPARLLRQPRARVPDGRRRVLRAVRAARRGRRGSSSTAPRSRSPSRATASGSAARTARSRCRARPPTRPRRCGSPTSGCTRRSTPAGCPPAARSRRRWSPRWPCATRGFEAEARALADVADAAARTLGLNRDEREAVRLAAELHQVGRLVATRARGRRRRERADRLRRARARRRRPASCARSLRPRRPARRTDRRRRRVRRRARRGRAPRRASTPPWSRPCSARSPSLSSERARRPSASSPTSYGNTAASRGIRSRSRKRPAIAAELGGSAPARVRPASPGSRGPSSSGRSAAPRARRSCRPAAARSPSSRSRPEKRTRPAPLIDFVDGPDRRAGARVQPHARARAAGRRCRPGR